MRSIAEQGVAEVIGTMALVFIGAGSVVIAGAGASSLLGVALAHGLDPIAVPAVSEMKELSTI